MAKLHPTPCKALGRNLVPGSKLGLEDGDASEKKSLDSSQPRVAEADGPSLHLLAQLHHVAVLGQARLEVLQLLALLLLHLQGDLAAPVQELGDLLEVLIAAAASGHGRRANAHSPH